MINEQELLQIINGGESSKVQFKERLPHPDSLAHEIIAFSNSHGGTIIFGVNDKTGALNGLSFDEIRQVNQQAVNVASQKVYPPVYLTSDTVSVKGNQIVVVSVEEGISKPYKDSNGTIYVKYSNPVIRNNQIVLFASRTLPYSGLGSGLRRALAAQPDMELENDVEGEQFIVRFPRIKE